MISDGAFNLHLFDNSWYLVPFHVLLATGMLSFEKWPFKFFAHF